MSQRILILFAHPVLHRSRVNAALIRAVKDLPGVTFHDLYEAYPYHVVDVDHEQSLLLKHEVIVWQHPFYWYSCPSLLKEWQDVVLEYGFAYGEKGSALHGKSLLSALTTGGPGTAYQPGGSNRYTLSQLLTPFEQTAHLCGMTYLEPFVVHGADQLDDVQLREAANRYQRRLMELRDSMPRTLPA